MRCELLLPGELVDWAACIPQELFVELMNGREGIYAAGTVTLRRLNEELLPQLRTNRTGEFCGNKGRRGAGSGTSAETGERNYVGLLLDHAEQSHSTCKAAGLCHRTSG